MKKITSNLLFLLLAGGVVISVASASYLISNKYSNTVSADTQSSLNTSTVKTINQNNKTQITNNTSTIKPTTVKKTINTPTSKKVTRTRKYRSDDEGGDDN